MNIKAIIAVRSGSERVENKNIRRFADSSLLEIKINQLKRISEFNGIIVNSNDEIMLEIAKNNGCETVKRDDYFASNTVSMSEVYCNIAENSDCDVIAYCNVTNPLIQDYTISNAIKLFKNQNEFDSLNTGYAVKEFLFKDNEPINYDKKCQPRSQDLPDIIALNFAVNIVFKKTMLECQNIVGNKPYIYKIDVIESIDIDDMIDFEFAELLYLKQLKLKN